MHAGKRVLVTLVALAAISTCVLAVPGIAAAETTGLCTEDFLEECSNVTHVHEESVGFAKLLSEPTVECNVLFLGDTVAETSEPLRIEGSLTYSSCNNKCTVKEINGPAVIHVLRLGEHLSDVTGEGEVELNCFFGFIKCVYNGENLKGHGLDPLTAEGTHGRVVISKQETKKVKGSCPEKAFLDITTEPLEDTYIAEGGGEGLSAPTSLSTSLNGGGKEGAKISVAEGSKVKDTATLSGANASTATGTVTYKVYKDKECKELATSAGEVAVEEGNVPDSEEEKLEAGKEYYWQVEYSGDEMNIGSTSTCSSEVLTVKANTSLSTTLSGGGKEGAEITVAEGSKVKDTATLSGTNASTATGTVDYSVYKDKECKELASEAGKGKVEGAKVASSEEKELGAGGTYYWQAKYLGDSLHEESTSTCSKEVLTVLESHKTALCTADETGSTCLEEHKPGSVDLKDSAVEFLTSLVNSKCEGLISSSSIGASGKPQAVTAEYTFKSCTNGCVITEVSGSSKLNFLYETSKEGSGELASVATEGLEIFFKCGETVKCTFGPVKAPGDALGALKTGDNGHVTFSKASLGTGEGPLCPKEAGLDALYVASSAIYIREKYGPTSLCSKDEKSPVCKTENQLKTIDYKDAALELLTNLINVKCESLASGSVGEPGSPLEVKPELTFSNCGGGCFVTSVAGPGKLLLERAKSEEATATAEGFEIFVKCGTTIKCLLGPEKLTGTALGALASGDNGRLTFSKASLGKGEGATCPKEATLDATYVASSATYIG